jgi:chromosome partitioning protein
MPASVVSVINYKGGVGKTTLTANLGADLAARGRRVLLIDLDPQSSLTFSLMRANQWEQELAPRMTILQWFDSFIASLTAGPAVSGAGAGPKPLHKYVVAPRAVNEAANSDGALHLLASHLGLIEVDLELAASLGGARFQQAHPRFIPVHRALTDALADPALERYDVVLIDCAPNFNMITRTALVASDQVLIPARPDYLSTLGIDYLRTRISRLVAEYDRIAPAPITPEILGVVYTMIQPTSSGILNAQRSSMERLAQIEIPVFRQTIRDNKTAITDAGDTSVPVVLATERTAAMENLRYELQQLTSEFIAKTRV